MPRVRLSRQAQVDFDQIVAYLSEVAEPGIAARYGRDIRTSINRLANLPHIGPPRRELGAHMRVSIVAPYLIFYDPDSFDGVVHIFRILHGARDITEDLIRRGGE
jgi:plasmid stabilization system protein ParE